jgi:nucleoside 2-deoxyribosyltransferase
MDKKVYLAGPFFNPEQIDTIHRIENLCKLNHVDFFSPRLECMCPPDATEEQRRYSFEANVFHIVNAKYILARIDDFDPGTMWEMGYASRCGVPTYAFTTVEGRGLNLMLAASGVRIIQGWDKLGKFLEGYLEVAIEWKKGII